MLKKNDFIKHLLLNSKRERKMKCREQDYKSKTDDLFV